MIRLRIATARQVVESKAKLAAAWIPSRVPASLVRFAFTCSRTPAVLLGNDSGGSALYR
jgi:hypothetical protein